MDVVELQTIKNERKMTDWKKILAKHLPDKGLKFRKYKKHLEIKKKKKAQFIKGATDLKICFCLLYTSDAADETSTV